MADEQVFSAVLGTDWPYAWWASVLIGRSRYATKTWFAHQCAPPAVQRPEAVEQRGRPSRFTGSIALVPVLLPRRIRLRETVGGGIPPIRSRRGPRRLANAFPDGRESTPGLSYCS
ncbi:hypothetical protein GCM10010361_29380 [Streptomyces olivaceiscleroticus]|uniref:Uncharacterized protein n=1 Tax=Streptomyces olivaceiscleroticus TaxID=68245 RepID=A0ABN0ZZ56_9ACTN